MYRTFAIAKKKEKFRTFKLSFLALIKLFHYP